MIELRHACQAFDLWTPIFDRIGDFAVTLREIYPLIKLPRKYYLKRKKLKRRSL